MYYIYHIPGKKIGVTRNLYKRVTLTQGYNEDEYEILDSSNDVKYISEREVSLQKHYGYKVDRQLYCNLIKKKMKVNPTEQTSTFPCKLENLEDFLNDAIGQSWNTQHGIFPVTFDTIEWILKNAKVSMFNKKRCYIYNKAFSEKFLNSSTKENHFDLIRNWANERGLYGEGDFKTQYVKLMEEAGELAQALLQDNQAEIVDAIGDMVIVLTNLAKLRHVEIEDCIQESYNVISKRTGKMINGTFVKDE